MLGHFATEDLDPNLTEFGSGFGATLPCILVGGQDCRISQV